MTAIMKALPLLSSVTSIEVSSSVGKIHVERHPDKLVANGNVGIVPFHKELALTGASRLTLAATVPMLLQNVLGQFANDTPPDEENINVAFTLNIDNQITSSTFALPLRVSMLRQFESFLDALHQTVERVKRK